MVFPMAGLLSTGLSFAFSRLCLSFFGEYASTMGIVFDTAKVYPFEWLIMAVVFVISVLPTFLCTIHIAKKDIIKN